jgi:hypothetical protein
MGHLLIRACAIVILCFAGTVGTASAISAEAYNKIPSKGTTFKKKMGYWTECYYSGLGEVCHTVYAKAKDGRMKAVPVAAAKLTKKQGQTMVCYWGNNNSEICYWAYSPRKTEPAVGGGRLSLCCEHLFPS